MTSVGAARWLVFAGLAVGAILFAANAADLVRSDLPGDYVEGVVLAAQLDTAQGISPYDPAGWRQAPFRINLYGPVQYWLGAAGSRFTPAPASLAPGRLLSLFALGLALVAVWWLQRRSLGLNRASSLLGVLLPLGYLPVLVFAPQNRPDTLAVAFSLIGLVLALIPRRWAPAAAGVYFVLAVFSKPTAIAAPMAVLIWFLSQRRLRDAGVLTSICAGLGGAWLAILVWVTHGGFFSSVLGANGSNPFALGGFVKAMQVALAAGVIPLAVGVAVAMLAEDGPAERLLALYFLLAFAMAVATVGKVGANLNYFVEPGLLLGPVLAVVWQRWGTRLAGATLAIAVLASMLVWSAPRAVWEVKGRRARAKVEAELRPIMAGQTVLSMEVTSVLRAGGRPYLNDPHIFARLAEAGRWSQRVLLEDLRAHRITVVLADTNFAQSDSAFSNWSPEVRQAIRDCYRLDGVKGANLYLYLPRPGGE